MCVCVCVCVCVRVYDSIILLTNTVLLYEVTSLSPLIIESELVTLFVTCVYELSSNSVKPVIQDTTKLRM